MVAVEADPQMAELAEEVAEANEVDVTVVRGRVEEST